MNCIEIVKKEKKKSVYQWDIERKIKIILPGANEVDEVHFAHSKDMEALVVKTKLEDGKITADIPNILLQSNLKIYVWLVCNDQTVAADVITVVGRKKPADYVYTETEVLRYENLEKRIEALEKNSCAGATDAVQYVGQELTKEQQNQARRNIDAASSEEVSKLSEDIAAIKQNGTGSGLTTAQRNSLVAVVNAIGTFNVANGQELIDNFNSAWKITINATGVTLDKTTLNFVESVNQTLVATVEPSDSTDEVMWASSNESIAKVTNGIVTPISNGSCTITATAGNVSASCEVTVSVESVIVTYTVVNNLTNVSTDNPVGTITENSGYTATLTPDTDYEFDSVVVTMGGVNVTSDVYANGTIVISKVTGNVVITASAKEVDTEQITYLSWIGTLDGESYIDTEYVPISVNHKYMFGIQYYEEKADIASYPIAGLTLPFGQSNWTMRINTPSLESNTLTEFPYRINYYFGSVSDMLQIGEHKYDSSKEILTITNNPMYLYLTNGNQALYSNEEMTEQPTGGTFASLTKNIEITSADDLHPLVPIYLGALNDLYANRVTYGYVKLYCFKVWDENDNLLVYMRPAKKGTQVGMYDEIRGTFHENKGSGSFEYEEV